MRRVIILLMAGLLFAGGCTTGNDDEESGRQAGREGPAETDPRCGTLEGDVRVVDHAMGQSRVKLRPERVVVLDTGELDSALALGVKPVGAVEVGSGIRFPSYLLDQTDGIEIVGTIAQPNLEAIAALNPDVILSNKVRHEKVFDQLSQIAPTVLAERVGVAWKDNFRLAATALGRCDEGESLFAGYADRLARFKSVMGDRLGSLTVSTVRSLPSEVRIYMKESFIGTVLADAGLRRPPAQDKAVFAEPATVERIPDLDADVMFLTEFGTDNSALEKLQANPLWGRLKAVQTDSVYRVPDGRWMLGIGIVAANEVVDDLFGYLVE